MLAIYAGLALSNEQRPWIFFGLQLQQHKTHSKFQYQVQWKADIEWTNIPWGGQSDLPPCLFSVHSAPVGSF